MSWDRLALVTPPSQGVITLAEAKAHLHEEDSDSDTVIAGMISAAQSMVEGPNGIGIALLTQTWRLNLDCWPHGPIWPNARINLFLSPVKKVSSVKYIDLAGTEQTLDTADYKVNVEASPAHIERGYNRIWPPARRETAAIKVEFIAGYGDAPSDIPQAIKAAMLLMVGHLYQNREATAANTLAEMPLGVTALLAPYRVGQFS
jgi:uncharacterized phiE125 gp8 family phage protein